MSHLQAYLTTLSIFDTIILAVSIWRQSRIIRKESGPWGFVTKFRSFFGIENGRCYSDGSKRELISCNKCLSVWLSVVNLTLYAFLPGKVWVWIFFLSGVTIFLESGDENWAQHCSPIDPDNPDGSINPQDQSSLMEYIKKEPVTPTRRDSGV